jgi:cytochrome d ubiquinol oxidase subunit I
VAIVHFAFQAMIAVGLFLIVVAGWTGVSLVVRKKIPEGRPFLWFVVLAGPLSAIGLEAGWIVTEVGRQPWIVQGVMWTRDAVTDAPGLGWVLAGAVAIYAILIAGTLVALRHLARK